MLDRSSWWPSASALDMGQKRRTSHDCGEGAPLIVSRDDKGYHAWCHRCQEPGWAPGPTESTADKLARLARVRAGDDSLGRVVGPGVLPLPQVRDVSQWPERARLWLYQAGLGRAEIGSLGLYYHPPSDRVVLPIYGPDGPVFWQARAYQPGRFPKYLGPTPRPPHLLPRWGSFAFPVLTEDLLSAMKIGQVGEGWAVLGTKVSDHMVSELMKRKHCAIWLDPDPAGRRGAGKIIKQLRAYGVGVVDILSERDPKNHNRQEIGEKIGEALQNLDRL